jgi:hypothetical protein
LPKQSGHKHIFLRHIQGKDTFFLNTTQILRTIMPNKSTKHPIWPFFTATRRKNYCHVWKKLLPRVAVKKHTRGKKKRAIRVRKNTNKFGYSLTYL